MLSRTMICALVVLSFVGGALTCSSDSKGRAVEGQREDGSNDATPEKKLVIARQFFWMSREQLRSGALCRFAVFNESAEPVQLRASMQNALQPVDIPKVVAPRSIGFITARCSYREGAATWLGSLILATDDRANPTISFYAIEEAVEPSGE